MWKKLAALISTSILVSSCQTSAGKPVNCLPAFEMKGRCAKVPQSVKDANRTVLEVPKAKPKYRSKTVAAPGNQQVRTPIAAPIFSQPKPTRPTQNVYGLPQ